MNCEPSHDISGLINNRRVDHKIDSMFPLRWSKRAMSGDPISKEDLNRLFEAARWAPSSFNNQPWRFIYALRDTSFFMQFLNLVDPENRIWAKDAGALVVIASKKTFDKTGGPSRTHSFDTGAAWLNFALQASHMDLVCHGMEGFNYKEAYASLSIPEDSYTIQAMAAVGKPGRVEELPQHLKEKECPNSRKSISEFTSEGRFPDSVNSVPLTNPSLSKQSRLG